ncbi:MAG: hypothetical protein FWF26_01205 [Treponema sp.]|nr:hypothetical protein [Treponema sp.]
MAKKKTTIGDLIKSDMSQRSIGEEPGTAAEANRLPAEGNEKKPSGSDSESTLRRKYTDGFSNGDAAFMSIITAEAKSAGIIDETDMHSFHDFMLSQAMRYIKGFNAGRRFHG